MEASMIKLVFVVGLVLAGSSVALRQSPAGCSAPEYGQFEFWVGEWRVTSGGQEAGTNSVTLEENRCLIHEHWKGATGGTGQSFNWYDRSDGKWHQVWVASSGNALLLTGTYQDGKLEYSGDRSAPNGAGIVHHRLTFFKNVDGTVRQLWETSPDRETWQIVFDGLYTRQRS
jgi:hypothetical protein